MFGHKIEATVAEAVLLAEIAADSFAPAVHTARGPAHRQPIAGRSKAIAQIVVVSVTERLVEQPDPANGLRSIGGIARTHLIRVLTLDRGISLFEIQAHRASAKRCGSIAHVAPLRSSNP